MTTQQFLDLLSQSGSKELIFEYQPGRQVPNAYHITEVKNVQIDSVDCGGIEHHYQQTVVQLWLSGNEIQDRSMAADKALKIFDIVHSKRPLLMETEIFFEYGFDDLPTSVYQVDDVVRTDNQVIIKMWVPATVCKPRELLQTVTGITGRSNNGCGSGGCC